MNLEEMENEMNSGELIEKLANENQTRRSSGGKEKSKSSTRGVELL